MLIWSPKGRAAAGVVASVLFIIVLFLPLAVILMSALASSGAVFCRVASH